ncbi:MAG TPA: SrtB family sortase [Eggerthellaceae bacterium]|nr:SrtB family sortase [Eggerthellaceae bacterium]
MEVQDGQTEYTGAIDTGITAAQARELYEADQKVRKRRRSPWFTVFVIAMIVLVASLGALGVIAFSYLQGQQKYDAIAQTSDFNPTQLENGLSATVDWDALLAANPDTAAWLYIPNTVVNYPVVQGQDNDHYLYYDFDGNQGWLAEYGAIFLDYRNKRDFSDPVSFIYGHHMNDGSMFASIAQMADQARFDECRTQYVLSPGGNYRLRSFALVHCGADEPIVETTFASRKDMVAYIQDKMDRSMVAVGDAPPAESIRKVFALATCDNYSAGRYILFCYVEDTTASGLSGNIGLGTNEEGQTVGFDNGLAPE